MDVPSTKKRKVCDGDVKLSPSLLRCTSHSGVEDTPENLVSPVTSLHLMENYASSEPAGSSSSSCSGNSKSLDLDENGVEAAGKKETRSSNESEAESGELELTRMPENENSPARAPEKQPSEDEIEEFFARCEKEMFKRFREKYNFDCEKEEPLEGRYEWVQI